MSTKIFGPIPNARRRHFQWSSLFYKWSKRTLSTWDIRLASRGGYSLRLLNNKMSGVRKSKVQVAQHLLLKTRKIWLGEFKNTKLFWLGYIWRQDVSLQWCKIINVQSHFYVGDLVTRTGDQEIRSVSGRLPDYPGELAGMLQASQWKYSLCQSLHQSNNNNFMYLQNKNIISI